MKTNPTQVALKVALKRWERDPQDIHKLSPSIILRTTQTMTNKERYLSWFNKYAARFTQVKFNEHKRPIFHGEL